MARAKKKQMPAASPQVGDLSGGSDRARNSIDFDTLARGLQSVGYPKKEAQSRVAAACRVLEGVHPLDESQVLREATRGSSK